MADASARQRLLAACYSFMVPVARFLLRSGISYREFADVARAAFVEVAGRDYGLRGRPTNVSRVAAMTGISRKQVKRLRSIARNYHDNPRIDLSPLSDVLHRWYTHVDYLDSNGHPRMLSVRGPRPSFESLCRSCAGDLPAGAIKVELIRCGAVTEDSKGRLTARRRTVIPTDQQERLVTAMVFNLRGLASTIAHNTALPDMREAGRIELFCESESLSEETINENRSVLRETISRFIIGVDDMLSKIDRSETGDGRRVGIGIYYYEDD